MIEGLLHVGSMAVLAGTVYLGLDRVGPKKDEYSEAVEKLSGDIRDEMLSFDMQIYKFKDGKERVRPIFNNHRAHLLFEVMGQDCTPYGFDLSYWLFRIRHAPGLKYLKAKRHFGHVGWLTFFSGLAFFYLGPVLI